MRAGRLVRCGRSSAGGGVGGGVGGPRQPHRPAPRLPRPGPRRHAGESLRNFTGTNRNLGPVDWRAGTGRLNISLHSACLLNPMLLDTPAALPAGDGAGPGQLGRGGSEGLLGSGRAPPASSADTHTRRLERAGPGAGSHRTLCYCCANEELQPV